MMSSSSSNSLKAAIEDGISMVLKSNFLVESQKDCILTLLKVITTILNKPDNEKVRKLRLSNATIQSKIVEPQGTQLLLVIGFLQVMEQKDGKIEQALFLPPHSPLDALHQARHLLQQLAIQQLRCSADSLPKYAPVAAAASTNSTAAAAANPNFDVYQGQRYDGKSAAVGTNLGAPSNWRSTTYQQLEHLQQRQAKLESKLQKNTASGAIPREWIATSKTTTPMMITDDSIISETTTNSCNSNSNSTSKEDAQLLAKQLQKQQQAQKQLQQGGFTTKAMRDLELLKKQKVYSHCQLAMEFPNGHIVKGNFLPKETIGVVRDAIRAEVLLLVEAATAKAATFDLYMTPPRTLLKETQSLQELGLVPAAKVYVSWKTPQIADIRPELFATSGPSAPVAKALVEGKNSSSSGGEDGGGDSKPSAAGAAKKKKKTKAEKEAALLKRMGL
jgi:hypothetical protein